MLAIVAATILGGCAKEVTGTAQIICGDWRQISVSKNDKLTDQTAKEIVGNNSARAAWCNPKGAGA
jgi:hypothetical protein